MRKNIGFLLEAFRYTLAASPQALLLITGDGPASADLRSRTAELGIADSVRFLGYLDRGRELPDCYAVPTLSYSPREPKLRGSVLLEAMAAGLPVLALSIARNCRYSRPQAVAAWSPPDDPQAFGETLADFFLPAATRGAVWPQRPRAHALEWSDGAMAVRLAALYRSLAVARCDPAPAALGACPSS